MTEKTSDYVEEDKSIMASDYVEEKHLLLSGPNVCSYLRLICDSPSSVSFFVFVVPSEAMDYTFIAAALQNQWNTWNIQGLMILSLCVQVLLAIVAPFRHWTSSPFIILVVWSAYLLPDWAAMFVFGLISNAGCRSLENDGAQVPPDVLSFWAAFLLVHLGGPDTITAFSLEDNALWMRHLIGLVAQLFVFMYIFVKTPPNNRLLVPTILIFVAGVINYGERIRALYLASLENLKKNIMKAEKRLGNDIPECIIKCLIIDAMPDLEECNKAQDLPTT